MLSKNSRLGLRRLDMRVGACGFELVSGGKAYQLGDHVARSILYRDMHQLSVVFAIHVMLALPRDLALPDPTDQALMQQFPAWPAYDMATSQACRSLAYVIHHVAAQLLTLLHVPSRSVSWTMLCHGVCTLRR